MERWEENSVNLKIACHLEGLKADEEKMEENEEKVNKLSKEVAKMLQDADGLLGDNIDQEKKEKRVEVKEEVPARGISCPPETKKKYIKDNVSLKPDTITEAFSPADIFLGLILLFRRLM